MKKSLFLTHLLILFITYSYTQVSIPGDYQCYSCSFDHISPLTAHQRDVLGQQFVVFGTGTLDTFYFQVGKISSVSQQVKIRIFKSMVGTRSGPGFGSYDGGTQNWGYYPNANDPEEGITPFKDIATDTHWVSTISGLTPSFSPLGNEIWGFGGYIVTLIPDSLNKVVLSDLGFSPSVTGGDSIFVTMEIVPSANPDLANEFMVSWTYSSIVAVDPTEMWLTAGIWKFYEHNVGTPLDASVPAVKGWRYITGAKDVALPYKQSQLPIFRWWFAIHPTDNVKPKIYTVTDVHNTLSTGSQTIQSEIVDLNGTNPSSAGVKNARIKYAKQGSGGDEHDVDTASVSMTFTGPGNIWEGTIPGQTPGTMVLYWVEAADSQGLFARTYPITYQVLKMQTDYYAYDTLYDWTPKNIKSTGTEIEQSDFFYHDGGQFEDQPPVTDNGTAGPFYIAGNPLIIFGDSMRYVWIGVDGAIALTASPTDTQHINMNGFFGSLWNIPPAFTGDTTSWMPKNFIAPLYMDMKLDPTNIGHIYYKWDPINFIVQWDSMEVSEDLPVFSKASPRTQPMSTTQRVSATFRVILNKADGKIEFQYDNVGIVYEDSVMHTLVGIQKTSDTTEWHSTSCNGHPTQFKPRDNWAIRFTPTKRISVAEGWNMVSVSYYCGDECAKPKLFPTAVSDAFIYEGSYKPKDILKIGEGFWLKFSSDQTIPMYGFEVIQESIKVKSGWNMIGTISQPFPVSAIAIEPTDMTTSEFFGYNGTQYVTATTLMPGSGYWLKVNKDGKLILDATLLASVNTNRIKIVQTSEMPPPPPVEIGNTTLLPREYSLEYNYPNPFNPVTTLKYGLPVASNVKLKIYNTLGQLVAMLVDEIQEAGYKSVNWNSSNIASGVYFYRLEATSLSNPSNIFMQVRKMIVVK
jgi:hypothetical protein